MYFFMFIILSMIILLYIVYIIQLPERKWYINLFLIAKLFQAVGIILTSQRDFIPGFYTIYLANSFLISGFTMELISLISFDNIPKRKYYNAMASWTLTGIIIFNFLPSDRVLVRVIVGSLSITGPMLIAGIFFITYRNNSFFKRSLGFLYISFAIFQVLRIIEALNYEDAYIFLETQTLIQTLFLITASLVLITGGVGFLFLLRENSDTELKNSNRRLKELFSIIGHDLRNPIANIKQISQMLLNNQIPPSDYIKSVELINKSSAGSLKLLKSLLAWGRAEYDRAIINKESIQASMLINEVIELYQSSADLKNITIENRVEKHVILFADREMIKAVVRNFLSNAIKFTPNGGKVSISSNKNITGKIQIRIKDTGIGIPEEITHSIFDISSKYRKEGTNSETGTGFGLKISEQYINIHEGEIGVTSKEGEGSTFWFNLPTD